MLLCNRNVPPLLISHGSFAPLARCSRVVGKCGPCLRYSPKGVAGLLCHCTSPRPRPNALVNMGPNWSGSVSRDRNVWLNLFAFVYRQEIGDGGKGLSPCTMSDQLANNKSSPKKTPLMFSANQSLKHVTEMVVTGDQENKFHFKRNLT